MTSIEELKRQLRQEKAKASLEDHSRARAIEKKQVEKELFELKHRKKLALFGKAKGTLVHMGRNAQVMLEETQKKKKKKRRSSSPFGNFNFG